MFLNTNTNEIKWNVLICGAVCTFVLILLGIFYFDIPLYMWLRKLYWGGWHMFSWLFSGKTWLLSTFFVMVIFYIKKCIREHIKYKNENGKISITSFVNDVVLKIRNSYVFYVFMSIVCSLFVGGVVKIILGRARPVFFENGVSTYGFFPFSTDWAFNSMPSGHTMASFAGLVMIGMLFPRIKWLTWSIAVLVGLSRVCVGAHWPSDVIFGAFIGMVSADIVKSVIAHINSK